MADEPVIVVGAGQAGLSVSYELSRRGIPNVILERRGVGSSWTTERWDSFCLVTPNWSVQLPGMPYDGPDPDGFMPGSDVVAYLQQYAVRLDLPVRTGVNVAAVEWRDGGYLVRTNAGDLRSQDVVVAAGAFPTAHLPAAATRFPPGILQLHSNQYRNAAALPQGAVLVVGTGQSGAQIAEELVDAGRRVFLCVGSCGRAPRTYRGRDYMWWLEALGRTTKAASDLPDLAAARRACKPHLSGQRGGHAIYLREFPQRGATLLGRFLGVFNARIELGQDLNANLDRADAYARQFLDDADALTQMQGLDLPLDPERARMAGDGPHQPLPEPASIDLDAQDITSVIWATGYRPTIPWVHAPVFDAQGEPEHERGVTASPGLYFLGLYWLHTLKSDALLGVGADAAHVAQHIAARRLRILK